MASVNSLWCEEFRPKTLDELIIPSRITKVLSGYINKKDIPSMIFYGPAGCCKTTTAKAIANTLDAEVLFINASDETGKSDILQKVVPFATGISMHNSDVPKIVILDEGDRITPQGMDSIKGYLEQFSSNCRFIFTVNTFAKMIDPIKSRCICIDFNVQKQEKPELWAHLYKRLANILNAKDIKFEATVLQQLIVKDYPDYRRILNTLQSYSTGYGEINDGILAANDTSYVDVLVSILKKKDFDGVRKWLYEASYNPDDVYSALYKNLDKFEKKTIPSIVVILGDYQYKQAFVANPQLNLLACFVEIMNEV